MPKERPRLESWDTTFVRNAELMLGRRELGECLTRNVNGGSFGKPCRVMRATAMDSQNRPDGPTMQISTGCVLHHHHHYHQNNDRREATEIPAGAGGRSGS